MKDPDAERDASDAERGADAAVDDVAPDDAADDDAADDDAADDDAADDDAADDDAADDDADDDDAADDDADDSERPLTPRHVRAAAKLLAKEAGKILKKHGGRIAAAPADAMRDCIEKIEALRASEDVAALEQQAKRLDELLHQHASFARKSALRETAENIAIAVIVALGLRSCLYEPFKIPSGSMMPTLRSGDHIFVNKFVYGVQIPFTTTVIGESIGEIVRGDVIVFRYPIDESEDFIKRVMALPGDEIRVAGHQVALKRAGESEFEILPHERLKTRCLNNSGTQQIANCALYEETSGDKTYVVRYELGPDDRAELTAKPRFWKVPEGHLLVMGDNRNRSHDSLAWTVHVQAVRADKLVTAKDLRDLTREHVFEMRRASEASGSTQSDPHYDRVTYTASHRSEPHDLALAIWRAPTLSNLAVFDTLVSRLTSAKETTLGTLSGADDNGLSREERTHIEAVSSTVAALALGTTEHGKTVVVRLQEPHNAVLRVRCGSAACDGDGALALRVADIVAGFASDPEQEARLLLERTRKASYSTHWSGRHNPKDHLWERRFAKGGPDAGAAAAVRLRAFRTPEEGVQLIRDAALAQAGAGGTHEATSVSDVVDGAGSDAWLMEGADAWTYVTVDHAREFVVVLSCGKAVCRTEKAATELAATVTARIPEAARDRRRMVDLLGPKDVGGLPEIPVVLPELYEFDDVQLQATVKDAAHSFEIETWLEPESGLASKLAAVRDTVGGLSKDDTVTDGGYYGGDKDSHTFVFGVPQSDVVVRVSCHAGLCDDKAAAQALAQRAANTALDTSTFVDPDAERPKSFVPRGNVKGRAERIWLPLSRFWLAIR